MRSQSLYLFYSLILCTALGCSDTPEIDNPYDNQTPENADGVVEQEDKDIDPTTIEGLHKFIFKPTCANSGCHDGLFEPDFRTIESSYNSLVKQPIIKNDELDPLEFRVAPGDHLRSMLVRRLEVDLNGLSGIMPLALEPDSDWLDKKDEYIANINAWIDNGAKDINGNSREDLDFPPQLDGMAAFSGANQIARGGRFNPIGVQKSLGSVQIWYAYSDNDTDPSSYTGLSWNQSIHYNEFDSMTWSPMSYSASPKTITGVNQSSVDCHFRFDLNLINYEVGDVIWIRSRLSDASNDMELPNENSLFNTKQYCAIRVI